jgi:hypothetical protein
VNIITIQDKWRITADREARKPHNVAYQSSYENMYIGLLAEIAVIHYLQQLADISVEWLSPNSHKRVTRGHAADIRWNGLELDVKLIGKGHDIKIKKNAEKFHHVFVEWHVRLDSFRMLGVLLPHAPETFQPPAVLDKHFNRHTGAVVGWLVPRSRLQPLRTLLEAA